MASAATSPALGTDPPGEPPRYVLVSHGTLADGTAGAGAPSAALSHPIVQYHYADDAPLAVLPRFPGERVLVLDHDPNAEGAPSAKSISDALAVMAVKVTDAPGAGVLDDEPGNKKMYVIETMSIAEDRALPDGSEDATSNVQAILARYKHRNAVLRAALGPLGGTQSGSLPGQSTSPQP